ncbi:MAG: pentapeptide repeat-containing protein, partial [Xenococcus sp. (in: cyanobacteria)]
NAVFEKALVVIADLSKANFSDAHVLGADLTGAITVDTIGL